MQAGEHRRVTGGRIENRFDYRPVFQLVVKHFSIERLKGPRIVFCISRMTSEATGGRRERGHVRPFLTL